MNIYDRSSATLAWLFNRPFFIIMRMRNYKCKIPCVKCASTCSVLLTTCSTWRWSSLPYVSLYCLFYYYLEENFPKSCAHFSVCGEAQGGWHVDGDIKMYRAAAVQGLQKNGLNAWRDVTCVGAPPIFAETRRSRSDRVISEDCDAWPKNNGTERVCAGCLNWIEEASATAVN